MPVPLQQTAEALDTLVPIVATDDATQVQLICIRPTGPFRDFDERLTLIATRFVRFLRVTILRTWDFGADKDWLGFVSATVPTVFLVRAGRVIAKSVGDLPYLELEQIVRFAAH